MKPRIIIALIGLCGSLAITGCMSRPASGPVWWNPTTWVSRVAPASVDRAIEKRDAAQMKVEAAEDKTVHAANVEVAKALEVLQAAPDSRAVQLGRRFAGNAHSLLNQLTPLSVEEDNAKSRLIADLLSENQRIREVAEKVASYQEAQNAKVSDELSTARSKLDQREHALAAASANLREAYDRENALANRYRNVIFILGVLAFLWIAGNILGAVARVYPPLAPVSRAINGIATPALAFAEARATEGLRRIGNGMRTIREKLPAVAEQVTSIFDDETDVDHKKVIGAAAGNSNQ